VGDAVGLAVGVAVGSMGMMSSCPTCRALGLTMLLAAISSSAVTPKRRAMLAGVSPLRTLYVLWTRVGFGLGEGVGVGAGEGVSVASGVSVGVEVGKGDGVGVAVGGRMTVGSIAAGASAIHEAAARSRSAVLCRQAFRSRRSRPLKSSARTGTNTRATSTQPAPRSRAGFNSRPHDGHMVS